jgi:DNA-binding CsgD family transcriptional regulator
MVQLHHGARQIRNLPWGVTRGFVLRPGALPALEISPTDVLHLFRSAREAKGDAFSDACFEWLERFLRFDVMVLAAAPKEKLSFGQALTRGVDARAVFESYAKVAHLDAVGPRLLATPGTACSLDGDAAELEGEPCRPFREHLERFEIRHGAGICLVSSDGQTVFVLQVFRRARGERMGEPELSTLAAIAPYLADAILIHRMGSWRTSPELRMDELPVALVDDAGCFKQLTPAFTRAYFQEREVPQGYLVLDAERLAAIQRGESCSLANNQILYGVRDEHGWLLRVRPRRRADQLTARERQVAYAYAEGSSYTEIADTLDIAPATVRRHLTNLYDKLAISHRVDLIAVLAE